MGRLREVYNIKEARGKPYNPREQGKVEKINGTIAKMISKILHDKKSKYLNMIYI